MALIHNPSIVRDGLVCYIDVNNKRCYDRTSVISNNLVNSLESLTAAFISNYDSDGIKTTLKNSSTEKWAINFNNVKTYQDFTVQFWANFKNISNNSQSLLFFTKADLLATTEEIEYGGQGIEFNGQPLTYSVFNDLAFDPQGGNITYNNGLLFYFNNSFNPKMFTSTINFSGDAWVFVTFTKKLSTIKFYKNNVFDEIEAPSSATRTATFSGIVGNNVNFYSNHIMLYDRALEHNEVVQNYNAFKNRYLSEPYVGPLPPPLQICVTQSGNFTYVYQPNGIPGAPPPSPDYDVSYQVIGGGATYHMYGHWNTPGRWIIIVGGVYTAHKDTTLPNTLPTANGWTLIPPFIPDVTAISIC